MTIDWRILLIGAALVVLSFSWLLVARADLKAQLATVQATSTALHLANDGFRELADRQMAAVTVLQAETALRARKLATAEAAAGKLARRDERLARDMQQQRASGDQCQAARRIIDLYRQQRP